jgi:hypothetical protein
MMKIRWLLTLPVVLSNCMLLNGRCLYEIRNVIADGNTEIAAAHIVETEQRDYQPDKDMSWQITGESLQGHVQKITLQEGSTVRFDFPLQNASLTSGVVKQSEGANLNGFFDLLSDRKGTVVITTDLAARQTVTIPLLTVQSNDWTRPYCS